jgi:methionyl-tRNA formyltransferase
MNSPRIVVFAYSDVGHVCTKLLLDRGTNVVAIYTHADNPSEKIWFPSVPKLAKANHVLTHLDADLKNPGDFEALKKLKPDLILSFYYRNMIPAAVLSLPKLGAYNMHGSFLPKFRGRAPVNWAVLSGEKQTGATLHVMVEKPDAGDIVDQEAVPIGPDDTTAIVQARVTEAAAHVLARQIDNLIAGKTPRRPQDQSQATYFGRRRPEDGRIDWSWSAERVHNLVRAVTKPYPGAYAEIEGGECLLIWKTRLTGKKVTSGPLNVGQLRREGANTLVTCGDGIEIEILEMEKRITS